MASARLHSIARLYQIVDIHRIDSAKNDFKGSTFSNVDWIFGMDRK
jgi:hypothetical protein